MVFFLSFFLFFFFFLHLTQTAYIFISILVCRKMDSPKGTSSDLLFYQILVDAMLSCTVILTSDIFRMSVERFL